MRILLIKPKHIGDTLILTPTIAAIRQKYPEAEIWVVVRKGTEAILAGCTDITRLLLVAPIEKRDRMFSDLYNYDLKTIFQIAWHRFDYAFELGDGTRGRNLLRLAKQSFCRRCYSVKPSDAWGELALKKMRATISTFDWQECHRVEKDFRTVSEFLPLPGPIPPLVFAPERMRPWAPGQDLTDFCVVQLGSRQGFARWRRESWRDVCRALLKMFPNIVLTCGPVAHEREDAAWLQSELGRCVRGTDGGAAWPEMAWLFAHAKMYVGPSTAAMHLAAACGCPVVALFGPTIEDHWHPWRVPYRIVTSPGYEPAADPETRHNAARKRTMEEIQPRQVLAACEELLAEVRTRR
ncbi:MAG TPA: glycosyltransferase family 9 protein [Candidatus Methylacidiphilales bacterium]|jgi:heptosyltransferase-3|nr:glycosyltransferase family 9 protein [Candidatus Methylacidiphilales bacterium]